MSSIELVCMMSQKKSMVDDVIKNSVLWNVNNLLCNIFANYCMNTLVVYFYCSINIPFFNIHVCSTQ